MASRLDVGKILKKFPSTFESRPYHSTVGDFIEFYFENSDSHAVRMDAWLTVYKAMDDDRLVGFKLKNIRTLRSAFDTWDLWASRSGKNWTICLNAAVLAVGIFDPPKNLEPYKDVLKRINANDKVRLAAA